VKESTAIFNRMGDMGKMPTSAWLNVWGKRGGLGRVLAEAKNASASPSERAQHAVEQLASIHRVGRKLATMYVSALSTPALAMRLTPWSPELDGNDLVVIDTNVARAVDELRAGRGARTYTERAGWIREQARQIDLRVYRRDLPSYSPRIVQQALYAFCSRSNRQARQDDCATSAGPCTRCVAELCPFA
jgi:hypothetical protein